MDDLPFDFTRYLSERLGVSSEQATDLLRSWLKEYEPAPCRPAVTRGRPRSEAAETEAYQQLG